MPKRSSTALTAKTVENMKAPKSGAVEVFDAALPGMCLRVSSTGNRAFILSVRADGKLRRVTLGRFDPAGENGGVTLQQARTKAETIKRDPAAWFAAQQAAIAAAPPAGTATAKAEAGTFAAVAKEYIARECPRLARGGEVEAIINRELLPQWGTRPMAELRKRDAIERTDALVDAGKPAAAVRLFEIIRRLGNWSVRRDLIELNPFQNMDPPAPKVMRDRRLSDDEIRLLWRAWERHAYPFGPLQKLLLVTLQRRGEVAGMKWSEIDFAAKTWLIPGERTKNGKPQLVPLPALAIEILTDLPRFKDEDGRIGEHVFTTTSGEKAVSGFAKGKAVTDKHVADVIAEARAEGHEVAAVQPWRWHDLRRTGRTAMAELGVPDVVAEKVLNHVERNVLVRTYNVHAYEAEKADALERWAKRLRTIITPPPANVVPMRAAAE